MRNTPLWRPQPDAETETGAPPADPENKIQRVSVIALVGLGLTLAVGIGAVGVISFLDGDQPPINPQASVTSEPSPAASPPAAQPAATPVDTRATPAPPVEVVDVAVAQSEADIAKLEEITGMVETQPLETAGRVSAVLNPAAPPNAAAASAAAELRPAVDSSAVVVPNAVVEMASSASAEPDQEVENATEQSATADDATQTASIEQEAATVAPAVEVPPVAAADAGPALPPLSPVKVNRYVNMRSGPADEARVVVVIPANATVQAQGNCGWCAVTYNGQRGYIYKRFLQRGGSTASSDDPQTAAQPAKRPDAPSAKPGLY